MHIAREVVDACRFSKGHRGFSPSCRAGGYGTRGLTQHIEHGDRTTTIVAMIEDPEAVADIDTILAVEGLDAVLIGRGDLAVTLGETTLSAPRVVAAVNKVLASCKAAGCKVLLHVNDVADTGVFIEQGASAFTVNSDQGLMRAAAQRIRNEFGNKTMLRSPA